MGIFPFLIITPQSVVLTDDVQAQITTFLEVMPIL